VDEGLASGSLGNIQKKGKEGFMLAGRIAGRMLLIWGASVCVAMWAGGAIYYPFPH